MDLTAIHRKNSQSTEASNQTHRSSLSGKHTRSRKTTSPCDGAEQGAGQSRLQYEMEAGLWQEVCKLEETVIELEEQRNAALSVAAAVQSELRHQPLPECVERMLSK